MIVSSIQPRSGLPPRYLLDKTIAATAAVVIFLELDELEFAEWLKDVLKVGLRDAEVDVSHVKSVEGNRVRVVAGRLGRTHLTVLLGFCKLHNDRDT